MAAPVGGKIILRNVICLYPHLFKRYVDKDTGEERKYQCSFMFPKTDTETKAQIDKVIDDFKLFIAPHLAGKKIPPNKIFITDGDEKSDSIYEGHWVISSNNDRKPSVLNRNKSNMEESKNLINMGCFVNGKISIWFSDHPKGGKQILANLHTVQFVKNGEHLSGGSGESESDIDDFDDLTTGDELDSLDKDAEFDEDIPF